jgi:hypothetical protein
MTREVQPDPNLEKRRRRTCSATERARLSFEYCPDKLAPHELRSAEEC